MLLDELFINLGFKNEHTIRRIFSVVVEQKIMLLKLKLF